MLMVLLLVLSPLDTVQAKFSIQDKDLSLPEDLQGEIVKDETFDIPLTNEEVNLSGLIDHANLYYTIPNQGAGDEGVLYLMLEYSRLLLADSTITISIEDKPLESIFIDEKKGSMEIEIPIEKEYLSKGFHQLKISFYGEISKELCTNEENPANWLTILPSSYISLQAEETLEKEDAFSVYPYPFIQEGLQRAVQSKIIIPNNPSSKTLSSALKLAASLGKYAQGQPVEVISESELKEIDSHLIAIGALQEWESHIKDFLTEADLQLKDHELLLDHFFLQHKDYESQLLLITAENVEIIEERISLLTEEDLTKQLAGSHLIVEKNPEQVPSQKEELVKLSEMQIPNIKLSGLEKTSPVYFYKLPTYVDLTGEATLHVIFNFSKTLLTMDSKVIDRPLAELVVYINGIPHSISMNHLEKDEEREFYEIALPIEPRFLMDREHLTIQFGGKGLETFEICVPPTDEDWIFIHNDSVMEFTLGEKSAVNNFGSWPYPFVSDELSETTIVISDEITSSYIKDLGEFINHLASFGPIHEVEILYESEVKEEQLRDRHLIYLGHILQFSTLANYSEDLLLQTDERDRMDLSKFSFLTETSSSVSWIQSSLWNDQRKMMLISKVVNEKDGFLGRGILNFLKEEKTEASIIVENNNGEIFTYTEEVEAEREPIVDVEQQEDEEKFSLWMVIVFLSLLLVGLVILILLIRARRKLSSKKDP